MIISSQGFTACMSIGIARRTAELLERGVSLVLANRQVAREIEFGIEKHNMLETKRNHA